MERHVFKSLTVKEATTKIRSREATEETRTLLKTQTTQEKQTQFTEQDRIKRNRIGKIIFNIDETSRC